MVRLWPNLSLMRRTNGLVTSRKPANADTNEAFLIFVHAGFEPIVLTLPGQPWAGEWTIAAHTGLDKELPHRPMSAGSTVTVPARTVVVLHGDVLAHLPTVIPSPTTPDEPVDEPTTVDVDPDPVI